MKEYAKGFYKSKQWQQVRLVYMSSINWVCERCGDVATICHHKNYIAPNNITNQNITLSFDNLEGLCQDCHNKEHFSKEEKAIFDSEGNIIGIRESKQIEEYKKAVKQLCLLPPVHK